MSPSQQNLPALIGAISSSGTSELSASAICRICKQLKPLDQFYIREGGKRRTECKPCLIWKASWKRLKLENPEEYNRRKLSHRVNRPYKKTGPKPKWTREEKLAMRRAYNMLHHVKSKRMASVAERRKNPEYLANHRRLCREWFMNNKQRAYDYRNNRRKTDKQYQISSNLRSYIYQRVGKKNRTGQSRFREIVGCPIDVFCQWLEAHFEPLMSWDNYGMGDGKWSIDHTRPCASFDLTDPVELKECFHFSNMLPMWWRENLMKRDKLLALPI